MSEIIYVFTSVTAAYVFLTASDFFVRATKILKTLETREIEEQLTEHLLKAMKGKTNA